MRVIFPNITVLYNVRATHAIQGFHLVVGRRLVAWIIVSPI